MLRGSNDQKTTAAEVLEFINYSITATPVTRRRSNVQFRFCVHLRLLQSAEEVATMAWGST